MVWPSTVHPMELAHGEGTDKLRWDGAAAGRTTWTVCHATLDNNGYYRITFWTLPQREPLGPIESGKGITEAIQN